MDTIASPLMVAVLALAVVVMGIVIWSVKRHRDPELTLDCTEPLERLLPSLSGLTHGSLLDGNRVELLENQAFFDALFEEIERARTSIHFETFLWKEGRVGKRLAAALAQRARDGLVVRVMLDDRGCKGIGEASERGMREAGCKVVRYHTARLRNLGVLNRRNHRKAVVFDGRVALVGGHCIVDDWLHDGGPGLRFHDLALRLHGPAVHSVQSSFSENWVAETGELFVGEGVFPRLEPAGDVPIHAARAKPERAAPAVKILHHMVLCMANERLWIQNPYFLPQTAAVQALCEAVKRGVDVRVMVPAAEASDMPIVQHAAHHRFGELLAGGVRIFEYPHTLLHQKVMTVDGRWCAVGSSNFDDRSFEINDEITLGLLDPALAEQLQAIFERDQAECRELRLDRWQRRGLRHRLLDRTLYLLHEQL
jgi:cardiolipin synthase